MFSAGTKNTRKALSILVLAIFCVQFVFADAWAAVDTVDTELTSDERVEAPSGQFAQIDIESFAVPEHLGEIKSSYKGPSDKFVIHIQDAHCNPLAQHRIAELINYFNAEYGMRMVNLEGGVGEYDLTVFHSITGEAIRKEVADYFVEKGELTGAEYFAVNNPGRVELWGVEDRDLYMSNLKVYRNSLTYKPQTDRFLQQLTFVLDNLKMHIYSPELLKIDRAYNAYKSREMEFRDYLEFLFKKAKAHRIDLERFGNLYLMMQAMEHEETIDFKKAEKERKILIDKLKQALSRNELRELVSKTVDFKTKRISRKMFYSYLFNKASQLNLDVKRFSALSSYISYVSTYEDVDRSKVMDEIDEFEAAIKEKVYRNQTERILNGLSRILALLKNIFAIALTKTDYRYYIKNKGAFNVGNFISFFKRESPKYKMTFQPDEKIIELDDRRENLAQFYELSFKRDEAFLENIRFTTHTPQPPYKEMKSAILVTGGFHTENLCELLKENDISYVSILPSFMTAKGWLNPYFEILAGETTSVQQALRSAIVNTSMMAIASRLNSLGDDVWGDTSVEAYKVAILIRARLIENPDTRIQLVDRAGEPIERAEFGEGPNVTDVPISELLDEVRRITAEGIEVPIPKTAMPPAAAVASMVSIEDLDVSPAAKRMYESAVNSIVPITGLLRRGVPTYVLEPSISQDDKSPVMSYLKQAEQELGRDGFDIHARSYSAEDPDTWTENLNGRIKVILDAGDFMKDVGDDERTRMVIRLALRGADIDKREAIKDGVKDHMRNWLEEKKYPEIDKVLDKIRFVGADIEDIGYVNTSIDLLTDITMVECDRYNKPDGYPGQPVPESLAMRLLSLLNSSISNFDAEFKGASVDDVLKKIFQELVVLKIRKIDWEKIRQWKEANDAVLRSL